MALSTPEITYPFPLPIAPDGSQGAKITISIESPDAMQKFQELRTRLSQGERLSPKILFAKIQEAGFRRIED